MDRVANSTAERKSTVVPNDNSPRWGDKFDFVMINAHSTLVVTVNDKPGFLGSMFGKVRLSAMCPAGLKMLNQKVIGRGLIF